MSRRPSRETIESLRLTLETLEQSTDTATDAEGAGELKRILLARIADLEMLDALHAQPSLTKASDVPTAATAVDLPPLDLTRVDLPPVEVVAAEEASRESVDASKADASQPPSAGQQQSSD